jgi:hypothetical protein
MKEGNVPTKADPDYHPEIYEAIPDGQARSPRPRGGWARLSGKLTGIASVHSGRWDLIVNISPGLGFGSPACFIHPRAVIEINGEHLPEGIDMRGVDLHTHEGMEACGPVAGLFCHECAHTRYTRWTAKVDEREVRDGRFLKAAMWLEESRIEAAHIKDRPADREWLHKSAVKLAADHVREIDVAQRNKRWAVGASALVLARADAGSLDWEEITDITTCVKDLLGEDLLAKLRRIWQDAQATGDKDARTMLRLGKEWVELTADPDDGEESPIGILGGHCGPPKKGREAPPTRENEAVTTPGEIKPVELSKGESKELVKELEKALVKLNLGHGPCPDRKGAGVTGWRDPEKAEKSAARKLAKALREAVYRARSLTAVPSPLPPGRLRMGEAMAMAAAEAAGHVSTAMPFRRRVHRANPAPPLKIGYVMDCSGSMTAEASAIGVAGWMVSYAGTLVPKTKTALLTYCNSEVRPVIYPGRVPDKVPEITATGGNECVGDAIEAVDAVLGLSRKGAARLLVMVTDSQVTQDGQAPKAAKQIKRLLATGCKVLWITNTSPDVYRHTAGGNQFPWPNSIPGVVTVSSHGTGIIPVITKHVVKTLAEA